MRGHFENAAKCPIFAANYFVSPDQTALIFYSLYIYNLEGTNSKITMFAHFAKYHRNRENA